MASLGNPTEHNARNFSRGYLTEIFSIFNQFHQLNRETKILQGVPPRTFFSLFGSLQNQSQILIVRKKNKALPEGGQKLDSKKDTGQDRVIIRSRVGYRTR